MDHITQLSTDPSLIPRFHCQICDTMSDVVTIVRTLFRTRIDDSNVKYIHKRIEIVENLLKPGHGLLLKFDLT